MTSQLVCTVPEAGALLDLGRWASYEAARRGDIPTIAIGRLLKVPISALADKVGMSREDVIAALEAERSDREAAA